jgi:hypothetical protein
MLGLDLVQVALLLPSPLLQVTSNQFDAPQRRYNKNEDLGHAKLHMVHRHPETACPVRDLMVHRMSSPEMPNIGNVNIWNCLSGAIPTTAPSSPKDIQICAHVSLPADDLQEISGARIRRAPDAVLQVLSFQKEVPAQRAL